MTGAQALGELSNPRLYGWAEALERQLYEGAARITATTRRRRSLDDPATGPNAPPTPARTSQPTCRACGPVEHAGWRPIGSVSWIDPSAVAAGRVILRRAGATGQP